MKHLKKFNTINENNISYKLPASTGDSDKDEEVFLFSTEDKNKSIILNMFLDKVNSSKIFGNPEDLKWTDLYCKYVPGDGVVTYTLEFYSPDENIKKETDGSVEGHEWMVLAQVPSDLIEKINSGELSLEEGEKQIQSKIEWSYKDGLDKSVGGWQIKTIDSFKQRNQWLSQEKEKDSRNPKWVQKFSNWLTNTFG